MRRRERYRIIKNYSSKTSYILFLGDYRLCGNRARIGELDESFPEYVSWGQPGRSRGYYGCLVLGIDVHRLLVGIGDRKVNRLKADVTYFLDDSDP